MAEERRLMAAEQNAPTPDIDLLDQVMDHIETHPEEWGQGAWVCGTTACVGGRTCLLSGDMPVLYPIGATGRMRADSVLTSDGVTCDIGYRAEKLLGLTSDQADRLFWGANTLDDVRSMVRQIKGGPYESLSWEQLDDDEDGAA
jgi:hypothetical protein